MLFGDFFNDAIVVNATIHGAMAELAKSFHGAGAMAAHGLQTVPFWLAVAGVAMAWWFYLRQPSIPAAIARRLAPVKAVLDNKYFFDWFNENVLAPVARSLGRGLWKGGDEAVIDGVVINGSARAVGAIARLTRLVQTGHLYWYALVMALGLFGLLTWKLWPTLSARLPW
jgi:NADH-quinone oxidoreductase subunit L